MNVIVTDTHGGINHHQNARPHVEWNGGLRLYTSARDRAEDVGYYAPDEWLTFSTVGDPSPPKPAPNWKKVAEQLYMSMLHGTKERERAAEAYLAAQRGES